MRLKYWIYKQEDKFNRFIAWHLPARIVMWSYMRVVAHATSGQYSRDNISEVPMMDAIDRFYHDNNVV